MATRLLSALLGIILLIVVMMSPGIYLSIALTILAIFALYELFSALEAINIKPIRWIGYLSVIYIVLSNWLIGQDYSILIYLIIFTIMLVLFFSIVFLNNKVTFIDISATFLAIFYITFLLSFIILTRNMDKGNFFVWLIFLGGWITDSAAYFTGKRMGKTKLIPDISPKKTVEGSIGGVIGCTAIVTIYGLFINNYFSANIWIGHYILLGLIVSIVSQVGDLVASSIKRLTGIKDFGNIMPGHGGVIDRFDSILLAAPVVYLYLNFIM